MKSEHSEQVVVVNRIRHFYPEVLVFAIPNGGFREKKEAGRLKAEGVLSGIPDLLVATSRAGYHGLFIEMKRLTGGSVSAIQKERIAKLRQEGYKVEVCKGAEAAWEVVQNYLQSV